MSKIGHEGVEHEAVLEAVSPLIELEALLLLWWGLDGGYVEVSRWWWWILLFCGV